MKAALYTDKQTLKERIASLGAEITILDTLPEDDPATPLLCDPETAPKILRRLPRARVMVLSNAPSFEEGSRLLASGIRGYGNTYIHLKHLGQALDAIDGGNLWLYPEFMQRLIVEVTRSDSGSNESILEPLTDRERETALLIKKGYSNKEVASELGITESTVKQHLSHIFEKLDVHDRFTLAMLLK